MSNAQWMIWLALSVAGVVVSGLFSGLETGVYSLNRVRLHLRSQQKGGNAATLAAIVADPSRMLATLLIGTNIATNLTTSAMGVIFDAYIHSEWQVIGAVLLIETPLLFIFAETLPKDLFAAHADRLVYPFARPIAWLMALLTWTGLLPLITLIGNVVMRRLGAKSRIAVFQPRLLVTSLVKEGLGAGLVSDEQSAIVERVLTMAGRKVRDEMVSWAQVFRVNVDETPAKLWRMADETAHTRFPVVDAAGKVVGVLNITDALLYDMATCPPVRELMHTPFVLDADAPLRSALRRVQSSGDVLAVVTERDKPIGVASIKDLIEPITGELAVW